MVKGFEMQGTKKPYTIKSYMLKIVEQYKQHLYIVVSSNKRRGLCLLVISETEVA
jgi:CDGSH-type Zn-finger protein